MKSIFDIRPQLVEEEYGPEPSLRMLVEAYYAEEFDKHKEMTEEYLNKLLGIYKEGQIND